MPYNRPSNRERTLFTCGAFNTDLKEKSRPKATFCNRVSVLLNDTHVKDEEIRTLKKIEAKIVRDIEIVSQCH